MSLADTVATRCRDTWRSEIVAALSDYIRIPNVSRNFDPDWKSNGHMDRATELIRAWCAERSIAGLSVEVHELPGLSPVILMEIPAFGEDPPAGTVLFYGHLDKQPEMTGWREGLGPWTPVIEHNRLYGRGGADDGYAAFGSLAAIESLQAAGGRHARCVVLIEASEESGSCDLPPYLDVLGDRLGTPELVLCLDSGCLDDRHLWVTTSLRGLVAGTLTVEILTEGRHSGEASGVAPSSFRILRQLLDRVEELSTGRLLLPELHVEIPADRAAQARDTAASFDRPAADNLPFVAGAQPAVTDPTDQLLARTWWPTLSVIGADGLPPTGRAGNVLRPSTSLKLSVRIPPTCDPDRALAALTAALTDDPPYGAAVRFDHAEAGPGWNAPTFAPWLSEALDAASLATFGQPSRAMGEGGSIPFMGMLGRRFPDAQFVVTGVLGPGSNAHGPNEYLDLAAAEHVTAVLALVLDAHARHTE